MVEELDKIKVNFRFYTDIDSGKRKWTSLSIYELDKVLELLDIESVLIDEFDRRLSTIDKLQMNQLREECAKRSLSTDGKKVCKLHYIEYKFRHYLLYSFKQCAFYC